VRLPAMETTCVVIVPVAADWNVPPLATVRLAPRVRVRATAESHCKTPDEFVPTVRLLATAAVSMVTVVPPEIVTLSVARGTAPPDQIAGLLQLPVAMEQTPEAQGIVVGVLVGVLLGVLVGVFVAAGVLVGVSVKVGVSVAVTMLIM